MGVQIKQVYENSNKFNTTVKSTKRYFKSTTDYIPHPLKELLIWSILSEETELTDIFLSHRTEYGVHDRLVLTRIYKKLSCMYEATNFSRAQEMLDLRKQVRLVNF